MPAEFWQAEQFRQAFTAQHIGWVSRVYRTHPHHYAVYGPSGISQTLLGQWLGLRQPQVSRIEGGAPVRNLDTLVYWARVLRIPRAQHPPPTRATSTPTIPSVTRCSSPRGATGVPSRWQSC